MQRKAVGRSVVAVLAVGAIRTVGSIGSLALLGLLLWVALLSAAGDEGRQPFNVLFASLRDMLRARLRVLRLRLRVLMFTRIERLRLSRRKRLAADRWLLVVAVVVAIFGKTARVALLLVVWLALPELLLRRGDQAEVVLGVLIVVFRGDRVSGTLRVARQLEVFLGDVRRRSPDFHVRSIGLVHPRQWILMMTTFAVATPHALVLTVSHGLLLCQPLICAGTGAAVSITRMPVRQTISRCNLSMAFHKRAQPPVPA
jgi:hypothetical protein